MGSQYLSAPLSPKRVKGRGAPSFDAVSTFDSEDRFDFHDDALVRDFIKVRLIMRIKQTGCMTQF
jgi:hypothetical protein